MSTLHPSTSVSKDKRRSWQRATKFREHLSIISTATTAPTIQKSSFSPDSPSPNTRGHASKSTIATPPPVPPPKPKRILRRPARAMEENRSHSRSSPTLIDRLSRAFFPTWVHRTEELPPSEFRALYPNEPYPPPHLEPWTALNVSNKAKIEKKKKKKERRRWFLVLLIIILLFLFSDVVFLNVRVSSLMSSVSTTTSPSAPATSSSTTLSADAQACLTQFRVSAPSSPDSYSCGSCLPILQSVPSNFNSTSDTAAAQDISNAIQFCALKAVFDSAGNGTAGGNALSSAGWLKDVQFCTWAGVTCGGNGRVSQVELDFPAVPSSIPDEFGALSGLQSLKVTGNNQLPAGSIPQSLSNLTSLQSMQLQSTGITGGLPDVFGSMEQFRQLVLAQNAQMKLSLPSSLLSLPISNLVINSQPLSTSLASLAGSSSTFSSALQILSLTNTSLSGSIPNLPFPSLTELHLGSNSFTVPLPGSFPPKLTVIDLSGNPGLAGVSVPSAFCASQVSTCSLQGSGFTNACVTCQI